MRVRSKAIEQGGIPIRLEPYMRQSFITAGQEYEAYAIVVADGITFVQVVDDIHYPAWLPSWIFEVTDSTAAPDWICNPIPREDGSSLLLIGPEFVAKDEVAYNEMVELDADQMERFWERVDGLQRSHRADSD
jgi:hypothetical protein